MGTTHQQTYNLVTELGIYWGWNYLCNSALLFRSRFTGMLIAGVLNSTCPLLDLLDNLTNGQNGRHFADDIFRRIFLNEKFSILIRILLKFVHKGPIDNKWALIQVMAWRRTGDKPLSEPMPTHFTDAYICGTRGRWVLTHRGWDKIADILLTTFPNTFCRIKIIHSSSKVHGSSSLS